MNRNERTHFGLLVRASMTVFAILCCAAWTLSQSVHPSSAEVERRAEALLNRMTIEEKITLIGGINDFYTRAIPRLGLPALRMSDGPLGVHDYGETTAYPAGIAVAASWDIDLARR